MLAPGKAAHVDETRVVVYVGLPDGEVLDFVGPFRGENDEGLGFWSDREVLENS